MKKPKSKVAKQLPTKVTVVEKTKTGLAKITHSQTIRQSLNYQSAEVSYGIELYCADNDEAISDAVERAEELIEEPLLAKFGQQGKLLNQLSK